MDRGRWSGEIVEELEAMRDEIAKLYEAETVEIINEAGATPPLFDKNR
jgi:hypothetical protein